MTQADYGFLNQVRSYRRQVASSYAFQKIADTTVEINFSRYSVADYSGVITAPFRIKSDRIRVFVSRTRALQLVCFRSLDLLVLMDGSL